MRVVCLLGPVFVLTGCFSPSYEDCQLTCPGNSACPEGFACVSGFCQTEGDPTPICLAADEPDATQRVVDAHIEAPEHDAGIAVDAAWVDATPVDPTCNLTVEPPVPECGGPVLCAKRVGGITITAGQIYARKLQTPTLDAVCRLESADETAGRRAPPTRTSGRPS
jgi:hypothetical protein